MEELRVYWVTSGSYSGSHARVLCPRRGPIRRGWSDTGSYYRGRPLRSKVDNSGKLGFSEPDPLLEDERIFDASYGGLKLAMRIGF